MAPKNAPLPWLLSLSSSADRAGVSVSALNAEIATAKAIVSANCWYRRPVVPGKNATGTKTAISTSAVAMTAPNTSRIASEAACIADLPFWMCRSMFSMTTIASSTTMPVESTMANSVSVLTEKSSSFTNANAPMSDTGSVRVGMSVARQLWRKKNITSTTRPMASASVQITSRIDSSTTSVVLKATRYCIPGGKLVFRRSSSLTTPSSTSRALAVGRAMTPKPTASKPLKRSVDA